MGQNDQAWEKLFDRYNILDEIVHNGFYEIEADTIKTVREPRLMAKFDHRSNLPEVFKKNGISILPVSRSRYILGQFNAYQPVTYNKDLAPTPIVFPSTVTSIEPENLYSESAALHCAYVAGMIDDLMGEKSMPTVSGRMSSKSFTFYIDTLRSKEHRIEIANSQVEIDGGYESENQLLLIEAKNETTSDFLIRQLYYPYRLWKDKLHKEVRPVFFTHSNDIFSFFVYEFADPTKYNSLRLLFQKDYVLAHEGIAFSEILPLLSNPIVPEPQFPFPQADSFVRIVDLLGMLVENHLAKDDITANYNFDSRQTNYYTTAGMYLGLVERYTNESDEVCFRLTTKGKQVMTKPYKQKYLSMASCILEHDVFRQVFKEHVDCGCTPSKARVVEIMKSCHLHRVGEESTYFRRAQTILKWIDWILALPTV